MPMLRPHGPSGKVGISALDGENWAVFSQSKYPNEAFEFLRLFYKKEHYLQYCHSVPIHLTPIFKSMLGDPAYLANERIKKWRAWHDVMLTGLRGNRFLPLGFTRPDDNLLPFLAELDGSEHRRGHGRGGHGRRQEPEGGGRSGAEARRGASHAARSQALVVSPRPGRGE